MSEQSDAIADLDEDLARVGEDIVLRRVYGMYPRVANVDLPMRASVRDMGEKELVSGIAETDSQVIMSPTPISDAGWPGGELPSATVVDPTLPRRGDKIITDGRVRNVEFVNPISVNATLVRIELRISG
jgi:hypothetical protein